MESHNTTNVQILIEKVDIDNDQIIFRPYSTNFKHPIENYESFAVNISNLAPGALTNENAIKTALIQISQPYIRTTLYKESLENHETQAILHKLKQLENTTLETNFLELTSRDSEQLNGLNFEII